MSDNSDNFVEVNQLIKYFPTSRGEVHAVDGVSFTIRKGETLGMVGESGCGKSTIGKLLVRLIEPTSGEIRIACMNVMALKENQMKQFRQTVQIIFQDPYSSLDPRMSVFDLIAEPLKINRVCEGKEALETKVHTMMEMVGLAKRVAGYYPHELDGGRRQRIGVARALALSPQLIILDEPVSALDVSIQAQIINLLEDLQLEMDLTYLFISHDLGVVKYISDRVCVMYLGRMVEMAPSSEIFKNPLHPYTQVLLSAVPVPRIDIEQNRIILEGEVPSAINPPAGCRFAGRCPKATEKCTTYPYHLKHVGHEHFVACINA